PGHLARHAGRRASPGARPARAVGRARTSSNGPTARRALGRIAEPTTSPRQSSAMDERPRMWRMAPWASERLYSPARNTVAVVPARPFGLPRLAYALAFGTWNAAGPSHGGCVEV